MTEIIEVKSPPLVPREAELLESILDQHAPWIVGEDRAELVLALEKFAGVVGARLYIKGWIDGRGTQQAKSDSAATDDLYNGTD